MSFSLPLELKYVAADLLRQERAALAQQGTCTFFVFSIFHLQPLYFLFFMIRTSNATNMLILSKKRMKISLYGTLFCGFLPKNVFVGGVRGEHRRIDILYVWCMHGEWAMAKENISYCYAHKHMNVNRRAFLLAKNSYNVHVFNHFSPIPLLSLFLIISMYVVVLCYTEYMRVIVETPKLCYIRCAKQVTNNG